MYLFLNIILLITIIFVLYINYVNNLFFAIIGVRILKALKYISSTDYFVSEFIYAADIVQSTGSPITAPAVPSTQGKTNVLPSTIVLS